MKVRELLGKQNVRDFARDTIYLSWSKDKKTNKFNSYVVDFLFSAALESVKELIHLKFKLVIEFLHQKYRSKKKERIKGEFLKEASTASEITDM